MGVPSRVCFPRSLVVLAAVLLPALPASAQATRTWVSGVGDDANPCSRTAPCKTFAGAISKTAAGGAINVLDPGGFGAVTITKSMTISAEGVEGGVLAAGTNGIVINAPSNAVVVLRGLDIDGAGTGLNGVRFLSGGSLHVENCTISNFTQKGIDFEPSGASELFVTDTVIRNNQGATSGGIYVKPAGGGSAKVAVERTTLHDNQFGMRIEGGTTATVNRSFATGNFTNGFLAVGTAVGTAELNLESTVSSNNGTNGVRADVASATVRVSNTTVMNNTGTGLSANGGSIVSFGNNCVRGNGVDGSPTTTLPLM